MYTAPTGGQNSSECKNYHILHLNCIERYEDMIDRHSYRTLYTTLKLKIEKKYSALNGTQTHDLCDTTDKIFHIFTCNRIIIYFIIIFLFNNFYRFI